MSDKGNKKRESSAMSSDGIALVYDKLDDRRESTNVLLWQVPTLSLTAQAFLLSVSLDPSVSSLGRALTAAVGTIAAVATLQLFVRHRYLEERMSVMLHEIEEHQKYPPAHQIRTFDNRLMPNSKAVKAPTKGTDSAVAIFKWKFKHFKSFNVWIVVLGFIALVDLGILAISLSELAGGPDWLSGVPE